MGQAKRKPVKKPHSVAICIPSTDIWKADFGMALTGLATRSTSSCALAMINLKGSQISKSRNDLVDKAIALDADYVLFIDSDMTFPPDALLRLIAHGKDIVGATYNKRVPPYETLGRFTGEQQDVSGGGLFEADRMPGGFMLVKTAVYRTIPYPWYFEVYDDNRFIDRCQSEDYSFSEKAKENGFKLYCDLDLTFQMGHIGEHIVTSEKPPSTQSSTVLSSPETIQV